MLGAIPEQDAFYDIVDQLEKQGMEAVVRRYQNAKTADEKELVEQLQIYEAMLQQEDSKTTVVEPRQVVIRENCLIQIFLYFINSTI